MNSSSLITYDSHRSILSIRWGLIVALIIAAIFLPFVVTVYAITGFVPNIQNLVQVCESLFSLHRLG
jgi:hypothetical protein